MRHGFQSTSMTIALPEHDDLPLLKIPIIRQKGIYNNKKQQLSAADEVENKKEKQDGITSLFNQEYLFSDR